MIQYNLPNSTNLTGNGKNSNTAISWEAAMYWSFPQIERKFSEFKDQFKDSVYCMCFVGTVVASWSLLQGMLSSNPFTIVTNILVTEVSEFNENIKINPK